MRAGRKLGVEVKGIEVAAGLGVFAYAVLGNYPSPTDSRASPTFTGPASSTVFRHEHRAPSFHYLILMGVSGGEVYGQKPPSASNRILGKPGSEQDCIFFADGPGERQLLSGVDGARRQVDLLKDNSQRVGAQGCGRH